MVLTQLRMRTVMGSAAAVDEDAGADAETAMIANRRHHPTAMGSQRTPDTPTPMCRCTSASRRSRRPHRSRIPGPRKNANRTCLRLPLHPARSPALRPQKGSLRQHDRACASLHLRVRAMKQLNRRPPRSRRRHRMSRASQLLQRASGASGRGGPAGGAGDCSTATDLRSSAESLPANAPGTMLTHTKALARRLPARRQRA
jgi:hypothetical protein